MLFSVVIPTYKRNDLLALCLENLKPGAQTLNSDEYEVIVSNDAANPSTESMIRDRFPWARYTIGPQRGPAANRNHGAALAQGKWLVFTDDDCLPDVNWLQAYCNAIKENPQCRAFEGAILPEDWSLLKKDMAECPVNTEGGCFWSANVMIEKQLFFELGGFDEQFLIAAQEDQDLQWRIQKKREIVFVKQAFLLHPVRTKRLMKSLQSISMRAHNYEQYCRKISLINEIDFAPNIHYAKGIIYQAKVFLKEFRSGHFGDATISAFTIIRHYLPKYLQTLFK